MKRPPQLERGLPSVVVVVAAAAVWVWERAVGCGPKARGLGPPVVLDMGSGRLVRWSWGEGWSAGVWGLECERLPGGVRSFAGGQGRSCCDDYGGFDWAGSENCGCCGRGFEQAFQLSCCEGRGGAVVSCKMWQAAAERKTTEQAAVAEGQLDLNSAVVAGESAAFGDDD